MTSKLVKEKASAEQVGNVIKEAYAMKSAEVLIYVGPQVKGLQRFSSFVGGYPVHLNEHLEKCPAFKQLFINPTELSTFEMNLKDGNTVESMLFKKANEYFSEVK